MLSGPYFSPDAVQLFWTLVLFVLGLMWGSFFNVCIYRVPAGLSVLRPKRSYCYACGTMVGAADNIPVLSYLLLGGSCRHCGTPFSPRYMFVELLTGLVFALIGWHFGRAGLTPAMLLYCAFAGLLIVATFTDIDHFIIPDGVSVGGGIALAVATVAIAAGCAATGWPAGFIAPIATAWPLDRWGPLAGQPPWAPVAASLAGALFGPFLLYSIGLIGKLIFRREAMGLGDVKLMIGIGAILGVVHTLAAFFLACVIGAVLQVSWLMIQKALGRRQEVLRRVYDPVESRIERARAAEMERAEREEGDSTAEAPGGTEEAAKSGETPGGNTDIFKRLGRVFARAARERRPYTFSHLPFGPYLAIAAIIVLFIHPRITRDVNDVLHALELKGYPPYTIEWDSNDATGLE